MLDARTPANPIRDETELLGSAGRKNASPCVTPTARPRPSKRHLSAPSRFKSDAAETRVRRRTVAALAVKLAVRKRGSRGTRTSHARQQDPLR